MLFVTTSGLEFTCTHAHECPSDRCLSVAFTAEAIEELQCAGLPAMRASARYESSRQRFLRHRMLTCRAGDEMRFELLAGALYQSLTGTDGRPVRGGGAAVTDVMRRIDRAAQLIEAEYGRPLTLRQLADAAGMSAYHFSRVFHTLTGLPPHRYLTAVRLRHAVRLLDQGASVTHTCFEVGFVSLSHFTTAFRRRFGVLPSARRRGRRLLTLRAALANPLWSRRTSKAVSGER
jgi:AraC-like DNA-binding protein